MSNTPTPTNRRIIDTSGSDYFPTPAWATHALMQNEKFKGGIWEPACGNGAMSEVLYEYADCHEGIPQVFSSDICVRDDFGTQIDFLTSKRTQARNIVTNPPYKFAEQFVRRAYKVADSKIALLLRLAFLEGAKRATGLFVDYPLTRLWVFSERITFYPVGADRAGGGTTAYAWFIWDKEVRHSQERPEIFWLKPGYRAEYGEG